MADVGSKPYWCDVCEKQMTSAAQLREHVIGKDHRKALARQAAAGSRPKQDTSAASGGASAQPDGGRVAGSTAGLVPLQPGFHCTVCNFSGTSAEDIAAHNSGKKHLKRLHSTLVSTPSDFYCDVCKTSATSHEGLQDHLKGKPHQKNLKRSATDPNSIFCQICNTPCVGQEQFEAHCLGKSHIRKCQELGENLPESVRRKLPTPRFHPVPLRLDVVGEEPKSLTAKTPRDYQHELYRQALTANRVLYLPTGMGKTLLGTCVLSRMLQLNPSYQVVFLVDRVLLVVQQAQAIREELKNVRLPGDRPVHVAALCGGKEDLEANMVPGSGHQHDIVVATAGCYRNLLERKVLFWQDVSCMVIDEVHHCGKRHPFHTILKDYYHDEKSVHHPRLVGLTASPAGQLSVEKTLRQLRALLHRMSAKLGTVIDSRDGYNAFLRRAELRCAIVKVGTSVDETQLVEATVRSEDKPAQKAVSISVQPTAKPVSCASSEERFRCMLLCIAQYLQEALRMHSGCGTCGKEMAILSEYLAKAGSARESYVRDTMLTVYSMASRALEDTNTDASCKTPLKHFQCVAHSWLDLRERKSMEELKTLSDNECEHGFKKAFTKQLKSAAFIQEYLHDEAAVAAVAALSRLSVRPGKENLAEEEDGDTEDYMYTCADESDDDISVSSFDDGEAECDDNLSDSDHESYGGNGADGEDGLDEEGEEISKDLKECIHQKVIDELLILPWHKDPRPIALVLVEKRSDAAEMLERLEDDPQMAAKNIGSLKIIGQGSTVDESGMTVKKQTEAMARLKTGRANIAVCTSVAEEGLDLPSCSLVIKTKLPHTVPSLVQSWGRARASGATFFVICTNLVEKEKVVQLLDREKNMERAAQQLIDDGEIL